MSSFLALDTLCGCLLRTPVHICKQGFCLCLEVSVSVASYSWLSSFWSSGILSTAEVLGGWETHGHTLPTCFHCVRPLKAAPILPLSLYFSTCPHTTLDALNPNAGLLLKVFRLFRLYPRKEETDLSILVVSQTYREFITISSHCPSQGSPEGWWTKGSWDSSWADHCPVLPSVPTSSTFLLGGRSSP